MSYETRLAQSAPKWIRMGGTMAAAILLASSAFADRTIDQTVAASVDGIVVIDNVAGTILVEGWDRPEVKVTGRVGDEVKEVEVKEQSGRVVIDVELPSNTHGDIKADLVVFVPHASEIRATGVSAAIEVSGVTGRLELETVSGNVDVDGGGADLDAESVSGSLKLEGQFTEVRAEVVSGRVLMRGSASVVRASTVSGSAEVRLERLGRVALEAVSGNVTVTGDAVESGAVIDANTHSGSARLTIPASTSARISLQTHSGDIRNDLGPEPERPRYGPGRHVEFTLGGGDARIRVQTFSGSVSLREQ